MKYLKVTLISTLFVVIGIIVLPVIAFVTIKTFYLTPEKLTSLIKQEVNDRTNIQFDCQSIELNYWDTWPTISISIEKGHIKCPAADPNDSIKYPIAGKFEKITGGIDFMQFLKNKEININNVQIEQPDIRYISGKQIMPLSKSAHPKTNQNIHLQINEIKINDANLSYRNKKGTSWNVIRADGEIKGELAVQNTDFDITLKVLHINSSKNIMPGKKISLVINSHCNTTDNFKAVTFHNAKLTINDFPFSVNGSVKRKKIGETPTVDVNFKLMAVNLKDLIDYIPAQIPQYKDYNIDGKIALNGSIKGPIKGKIIPDIQINGFIQDGSLIRKDMKYGIDQLSLNLNFNHFMNQPDSSYLTLDNLKAEGLGSKINMRCMISNPLKNPYIAADVLGNLDFNRLSKEFLPKNTTNMDGKIKLDMACAFLLDDLKKQKFQHIKIQGNFQADNVVATNEKENLNLYAKNIHINVSNQKNKSNFITENEVLSGLIDIDTLNMVYKQSANLNLSQLHIRTNTVPIQNKESIQPITAHMNCNSLSARLAKGQWISGNDIEVHAGTKASSTNPQKEERALVVKANTIKYIDSEQQHAAILRNSNLISEFRPSQNKNRKWDIKGIIELNNSQLYTIQFPIEIDIRQGFLHFQNDQFTLNRFDIQAGKSDCILSGSLTVDSKKKELLGSLQILSQYINYDELNQTFLYGKASTQKKETRTVQDLTIDKFEQKIQNIRKNTKITNRTVLLPKNLSLNVLVDINESNYKEISFQQIKGNITLKGQKALADFSTRTNLGKISVKALYDSRQKEDIKTVFDVTFKDVLVAQIHKVIPTVETMLPITKSMDGLADCHITAFTKLDTQMLPALNTTKAVCSFKGQKLVIFDNKTFNEIAKRFRFKNKKNNEINHLETKILMNNGKIEVIPFTLQWDRYKAIAGGTHGIDMTYNYHVDMLKSPIPIDFGIDISGKVDNLKYKITKCKYKNLFKDESLYNKEVNQKIKKVRQGISEQIKL